MRWVWICLLTLLLAAPLSAAEARIKKVLQHLEDRQGRIALQPSLYERDAYQFQLRQKSELVGSMRFDVYWSSSLPKSKPLKLRMEVVSANAPAQKPALFEQELRNKGRFRNWSSVRLDKEAYVKLGKVISWRATLWDGETLLSEQKSFLW